MDVPIEIFCVLPLKIYRLRGSTWRFKIGQPAKSNCVSNEELYLPDEVHILPNRRGPEYSILAEYEHQRSSIHDANLQ